jgi:tetratricopeptide (TPR) repeat protein
MPVHNEASHLAEALDSLLTQTYRDLEIVCIDDGSTDGSPEILAAYRRRDRRLVVRRQTRSGIVDALNHGCRLARGRYLARMDADDVALPDRLERQVAFLDRHPEVAVVGGAVILISADGTPFATARCPVSDPEIRAALIRSNPLTHSAVMMRKAAFHAVGGYRPVAAHAEDYDLWLRMAERYRLAGLAEPVLRYRVHARQVTSRRLQQQALASLAVRMAADARREQGHDPLLDVADAADVPAVLDRLGVGEPTITSCLLDAYISHAYALARSGEHAEARAVWQEALTATRRPATRHLRGSVLLARARLYREQRQPLRAVGTAVRACLADPRLAGELLRRMGRAAPAAITRPATPVQ